MIVGTSQADVIHAGNGQDRVDALGGDDEVYGENGDDQLTGGEGSDLLNGGNGQDKLDGNAGKDQVLGENGDDTLNGGDGHDSLSGGNGQDKLDGGAGSDVLDGDAGDDTLHGGAGVDLLYPDQGNEKSYGDTGNDVIAHGPNGSSAWGGDGSDVILDGKNGSNEGLHGDGGDDVIAALTHTNPFTVDGGPGTDVCYGRTNDTFVSCETIIKVSANGSAATVTQTSGPAQDETVQTSSVTLAFQKTNAPVAYCFVDDSPVSRCDAGSFTASNLAAGDHAIGVVALPSARAAGAVLVRRFSVAAAQAPSFAQLDSSCGTPPACRTASSPCARSSRRAAVRSAFSKRFP